MEYTFKFTKIYTQSILILGSITDEKVRSDNHENRKKNKLIYFR